MMVKKMVLIILIAIGAALAIGIGDVVFEQWSNSREIEAVDDPEWFCDVPDLNDDRLQLSPGGVIVEADPAEVKLELEHQILFSLNVANSGEEQISAWALDLGKGLYLVDAQPKELFFHEGHHDSPHGSVLIFGTPIESGGNQDIILTLRVLFDSDGNFDPNHRLKLFYARSAKDAQALAINDLQGFQDTFAAFPSAEITIRVER